MFKKCLKYVWFSSDLQLSAVIKKVAEAVPSGHLLTPNITRPYN